MNYLTSVALLFSLSLSIVDLLWNYNTGTILELSLSFTEKNFVDDKVDILCTLARR